LHFLLSRLGDLAHRAILDKGVHIMVEVRPVKPSGNKFRGLVLTHVSSKRIRVTSKHNLLLKFLVVRNIDPILVVVKAIDTINFSAFREDWISLVSCLQLRDQGQEGQGCGVRGDIERGTQEGR
jgi:hypothetical protein